MSAARVAIERWFCAALAAVDPEAAVARSLVRNDRTLRIGDQAVEIRGRVWVVAIGKAALPMARATERICGDMLGGGVIITKDGHLDGAPVVHLEVFEASHPLPDQRGVAATQRALEIVGDAGPDDLVVALISGGGSALLEAPAPPVTLGEMAETTALLLQAGAPIHDLNAVRSPLSLVKSGGLREAAGPTRVVTMILSDVLGNDARVIASGPTVIGEHDAGRALEVIEAYALSDAVPSAVLTLLRRQVEQPQARKMSRIENPVVIIGDNETALRAMRQAVEDDELTAEIIWREREGEARDLGAAWVAACRQTGSGIDVVLGGGEATVTVRGPGTGGRNTEFALAAGLELERVNDEEWAIASLATDGQDGPTGVAGAIVRPDTVRRFRAAGRDPERALRENDSLMVFQVVGGVVDPGPTGTNVNDVYVGVRQAALTRLAVSARE